MYRIVGSRRRSPTVLLLVGGISLLLFVASFAVEVRIIFERPSYGDVTVIVELIWRTVLGIATLGSFLLEIHTLRSDTEANEESIKGLEINGMNHDIDFHVHVSDISESAGPTLNENYENESSFGDGAESDHAEPQAGNPEKEPAADN